MFKEIKDVDTFLLSHTHVPKGYFFPPPLVISVLLPLVSWTLLSFSSVESKLILMVENVIFNDK